MCEEYSHIIIASGFLTKPNMPKITGHFSGESLHAVDYYSPEIMGNKNVLVIGGGQTAIDIVKDGSVVANKVFHSMRKKPNWFYKYNKHNKPSEFDYWGKKIPLWFKVFYSDMLLKKLQSHKIFDGLPKGERVMNAVIDSNFLELYKRKDVIIKPAVASYDNKNILFEDDTTEAIDLVIYATGYRTEFPFIEDSYLNKKPTQSFPNFFCHTLHPDDNSIFTCGIVHPMGGHWPTYDLQAKLIAQCINIKNDNVLNKLEKIKSRVWPNFNSFKMYLSDSNYPVIEKISFHRYMKKLLKNVFYTN